MPKENEDARRYEQARAVTAAVAVTGLDTVIIDLLAWRAHTRLGKRASVSLSRIIDALAGLADDYYAQLAAAQRRGDQAVEAVHMLHDQAHEHPFAACLLEPCRHITARPGDRLRGPAPLHLPLFGGDAE